MNKKIGDVQNEYNVCPNCDENKILASKRGLKIHVTQSHDDTFELICFSFDRDFTVDCDPQLGGPIPPCWVGCIHDRGPHYVWAHGNQKLTEEAKIPGLNEAFGLSDEENKFNHDHRKTAFIQKKNRLEIIKEVSAKCDRFVCVDDMDLSEVDGWEYYSPEEFIEKFKWFKIGEIPLHPRWLPEDK